MLRFQRAVAQRVRVLERARMVAAHPHALGRIITLLVLRLGGGDPGAFGARRSEEHTSELQSLMRISYAVFCLKKKTTIQPRQKLHVIDNKTHGQPFTQKRI